MRGTTGPAPTPVAVSANQHVPNEPKSYCIFNKFAVDRPKTTQNKLTPPQTHHDASPASRPVPQPVGNQQLTCTLIPTSSFRTCVTRRPATILPPPQHPATQCLKRHSPHASPKFRAVSQPTRNQPFTGALIPTPSFQTCVTLHHRPHQSARCTALR